MQLFILEIWNNPMKFSANKIIIVLLCLQIGKQSACVLNRYNKKYAQNWLQNLES